MTDAKRQALYGQAADHWTATALSAHRRQLAVDATIRHWEDELKERPNMEPREWIVRNGAMSDVKRAVGAIPWMLIAAIVYYLIKFLIDYLNKDQRYYRASEPD